MSPARTAELSLVLVLAALSGCGDSSEDDLYGNGKGGSSGAGGGAGCSGCAGSDGGSAGGGAAGAAGGSGGSSGAAAGSGSAGASAGTSGLGGESGAGGESGTAGSGGMGGGTATPGTIHCGGGICQTSFNICCTCPSCPIPYPTQCFPKLTGCTGTGMVMTCDDAADCANAVCCAHFQPPSYEFTGATCEASCPQEGNAQLCTVDAECTGGFGCKPLASLPGFRACQPA